MTASSDSPFEVLVFDKAFASKGPVPSILTLKATIAHNAQSTTTFTIPETGLADDGTIVFTEQVANLMTPGARCEVRYQGNHLTSGYVTLRTVRGQVAQREFTFTITDDWFLLTRLQAWPRPSAAVTAQTVIADHRTGKAETVFKAYINANSGRTSPAVVTQADSGRGDDVVLDARFETMADLFALVSFGGIGTTVVQSGDHLVFDCYTPREYTSLLTEASGVVQASSASLGNPEATRAVIGGPGDGTARAYSYLASDPFGLEALYGYRHEIFVDDTQATTDALRLASGTAALAKAMPKSGLSIDLAETSIFQYDPTGVNGVRVGDRVRVDIGQSVPPIHDVLSVCTLSWTSDGGLQVNPEIGSRSNDPSRLLANTIAGLGRKVRTFGTRR